MENRPINGIIGREKIQQMLDEVAPFEIELEADPTQPHLGTKYLQETLSRCRSYLNRVQYYMGITRMYERTLRVHVHELELNIDFKMKEYLADDAIVRQQPSIEDRRALAAMNLKAEHAELNALKADLLDVEESVKLLKHKYDHLRATSNDIKMQRHLVKDDMDSRLRDEEGYDTPQTNKDKTVPKGLKAPVTADDLNPVDLLTEDAVPEKITSIPATASVDSLSSFFENHSANWKKKSAETDDADNRVIRTYDDLLS